MTNLNGGDLIRKKMEYPPYNATKEEQDAFWTGNKTVECVNPECTKTFEIPMTHGIHVLCETCLKEAEKHDKENSTDETSGNFEIPVKFLV